MSSPRDQYDSKITTSQKLKKVVLDLDDVLTTHIEKRHRNERFAVWFRERHLTVWAAGYEHIVHPGVVEFLRFLYQNKHENGEIRVRFFSSAVAQRNFEFVIAVLILALGKDHAAKYIAEIEKQITDPLAEKIVFSRDDIDDVRRINKKNLLKTCSLAELESTILIDNERSNIYHNQLPNGLITQYADEQIFEQEFYVSRVISDGSYLENANQIFYVVGLLKKLLAEKSSSITQALFNLQYQKKDIDESCVYKQQIVLMSLADLSKVDFADLESTCKKHNAIFALIKIDNKVYAFGKPDGIKWELTELDSQLLLDYLNRDFPKINAESIVYNNPWISWKYDDERLQIIDKSIKAKHAHTEFSYEPKYEIYHDKSLYISGLYELKKFSPDQTVSFFGKKANVYFGVDQPDLSIFKRQSNRQIHHSLAKQGLFNNNLALRKESIKKAGESSRNAYRNFAQDLQDKLMRL